MILLALLRLSILLSNKNKSFMIYYIRMVSGYPPTNNLKIKVSIKLYHNYSNLKHTTQTKLNSFDKPLK